MEIPTIEDIPEIFREAAGLVEANLKSAQEEFKAKVVPIKIIVKVGYLLENEEGNGGDDHGFVYVAKSLMETKPDVDAEKALLEYLKKKLEVKRSSDNDTM